MHGFPIKPHLYSRFLDDIFAVSPGTYEQLAYVNALIPGIKVTFTVRDEIIEFLDTQVYKAPAEDGRCTLQTKVYFKPTDTHQLPHHRSFHPAHTFKGKGQGYFRTNEINSPCTTEHKKFFATESTCQKVGCVHCLNTANYNIIQIFYSSTLDVKHVNIDANPSSTAGVISILVKLHEYIPKLSNNDLLTVPVHGDCLSVECMGDAKRARCADLTRYDRLQGAEPVPREFHHQALTLQIC